MNGERCIVCPRPAVQRHHVVYQQELRRAGGDPRALERDPRNLVPVCVDCHMRHHVRQDPISVQLLPDAVFEFAEEVLGAGRAFEYLLRHYAGEDVRLDGLLTRWRQETAA